MKAIETQRNIGTNRAKARIWIEGGCLQNAGWIRGTRYNKEFGNGEIILRRADDGKAKIAGTDTRPIVDMNTVKISAALPGAERVNIRITKNEIRIADENAAAPEAKTETPLVRIPRVFYRDHDHGRGCPSPAIIKETKTHLFIAFEPGSEGWEDLLDDAEHYANHPDYAQTCGLGLVSSARATAKAMKKAIAENA